MKRLFALLWHALPQGEAHSVRRTLSAWRVICTNALWSYTCGQWSQLYPGGYAKRGRGLRHKRAFRVLYGASSHGFYFLGLFFGVCWLWFLCVSDTMQFFVLFIVSHRTVSIVLLLISLFVISAHLVLLISFRYGEWNLEFVAAARRAVLLISWMVHFSREASDLLPFFPSSAGFLEQQSSEISSSVFCLAWMGMMAHGFLQRQDNVSLNIYLVVFLQYA